MVQVALILLMGIYVYVPLVSVAQDCEDEILECLSDPCQNGANCTELVNGYECVCQPGYNGTFCETEIQECAGNPCLNGANCLATSVPVHQDSLESSVKLR